MPPIVTPLRHVIWVAYWLYKKKFVPTYKCWSRVILFLAWANTPFLRGWAASILGPTIFQTIAKSLPQEKKKEAM
jgi:hypothetical protein